jgi:phospholipid/cholesterol/gamma-HCH transport system substrate-binding protein
MALETNTTWARLRVGLMSIVALVILGVLTYLISGSAGLFKKKVPLYTYFNSSGAIAPGSPVRLNGILIGKVKNVELTGSSEPGRVVKLTMEVDNDFIPQIPDDSKSETAQLNLLGTKYVNIAKGKSSRPIQPGAEIKSSETPGMEEWLKQGNVLIGGMQDILGKVDAMLGDIQAGKGNLGKLIKDEALYNQVLAITTQIQKLAETLNSSRGIGKFINDDALYTDVRGIIARMGNLMDGIEQGQGTLGKFVKDPALFDESVKAIADVRKSLDQVNTLMADVNAGKGSAGKLLKSDELHNALLNSMAKIDALIEKVNNGPGSISMLLNDPSLYQNIDGLTREMNGLMKDFRKNPKKFLTIQLKLF